MRAVLCASLLVFAAIALACGFGSKPTDRALLPEPTATAVKVNAFDLYMHYSAARPFLQHQHEGAIILCKESKSKCFGVKTLDGTLLVLIDSDKAFRRPATVIVLKSDKGFTPGELQNDLYAEGVLRGAVSCESRPWSKDWLKLTERSRILGEHFILIEDAVLTSPPKN